MNTQTDGEAIPAALNTDRVTDAQRAAAVKLLGKGWLDPWVYDGRVYMFLPDVWHKRNRGRVFRSHNRPPVRITPTGRILAGYSPRKI